MGGDNPNLKNNNSTNLQEDNNNLIQINNLKNQIEQLNNEINKLKSESSDLKTENKNIKNTNNNLKNELNIKNNNINNYITQLNYIKNSLDIKINGMSNLKEQIDNIINQMNNKIGLNEIVTVIFQSIDESVNIPLSIPSSELFARLEEYFYNEYPEYKDLDNIYFTVNGNKIKRSSSIKENNLKNKDKIILNIY